MNSSPIFSFFKNILKFVKLPHVPPFIIPIPDKPKSTESIEYFEEESDGDED